MVNHQATSFSNDHFETLIISCTFGEGGALTKYRSPLNFEEMLTFVLSQEEPLLHVHLVVINTDNK